VLEGKGLRLAGAGSATELAFDTPKDNVTAAIAKALGAPSDQHGVDFECGSGASDYVTWENKLTVWFQDGRFVGWDSKGGLAGADGLAIGTARDRIAGPALEVSQSSLGTEFTRAGISGLFASKAANAKVTALWAGATCIFR
jgi:hypothetical protein